MKTAHIGVDDTRPIRIYTSRRGPTIDDEESRSPAKVYVDVAAVFHKDGSLEPLWVKWEDGRIYQVDRILQVRRAASLRAGGIGVCYDCRICGQVVELFYEENYHWFVARRE